MAIPSRTFDSIEGNDREREKERGIRAAIWWSRRVIRAYSRRGWQGFIHIYRGRGSLSGQSKRRGCEVLSEAAHSIARHKWQPKVELTENESRRGPERGRIILPFAPTIFEFPGKKFSIRELAHFEPGDFELSPFFDGSALGSVFDYTNVAKLFQG